uniref:Uncharacterized protein n=1 Tax=Rhizophora mucronata TaxID=61149 RepID=A0A2P2NCX4_RHIMU
MRCVFMSTMIFSLWDVGSGDLQFKLSWLLTL